MSGLRRRATCENENAQTLKQYQMEDSNPGCLDCEIFSQNVRTKHLTDQRHSLHHHQPVNSRLHSRNTFISTSHPLLCKPAEARASKWQEQWEQTDSNLRDTTSTQKNDSRVVTRFLGVHGGRPSDWTRDRPPSRQRNICEATGRAKSVCAAQPHAT